MINGPREAGQRSGIVRKSYMDLRDTKIIALRAMGLKVEDIAKRLSVHVRSVYKALRRTQSAETVIVDELRRGDVTAEMVLTRLSDMFNADIGDIIEPQETTCLKCDEAEPDELPICDQCSGTRLVANPRAGSYREIHEWPPVWRKMLSGSEVKELFERSKDGGDSSWDKIGELVKIKFIDPIKLTELLMRHKGVDAMVQQKQGNELHLHLHSEITQRLQGALHREQLQLDKKIIDVTPDE